MSNEVPILAAAIQAQPDWLLTDDTSHFNREVSRRTSIRIDTPQEFLLLCGKLLAGPPSGQAFVTMANKAGLAKVVIH
jgi:hypothetical protein